MKKIVTRLALGYLSCGFRQWAKHTALVRRIEKHSDEQKRTLKALHFANQGLLTHSVGFSYDW